MIFRKVIPYWLLFISLGCNPNLKNNFMQVEFDVFSGRPNPSWELSQEEANQIMSYLGKVEATQDTVDISNILGYRGFLLTIKDSDDSILGANKIRVYHEFIIVETGNSRVYRDLSGIERLLFTQASLQGYDDIVKEIK